jgi:hypothetical protein
VCAACAQVFVGACSHILSFSGPSALPLESDDDGPANSSGNPKDSITIQIDNAHASSHPARAAGIATYATRIALTAALRLANTGKDSLGAAGPEVVGSAFPLKAFIGDALRLQDAAFAGMHLLLQVLVAVLKCAAQSDIQRVLPELLKFTVGSPESVKVRAFVCSAAVLSTCMLCFIQKFVTDGPQRESCSLIQFWSKKGVKG